MVIAHFPTGMILQVLDKTNGTVTSGSKKGSLVITSLQYDYVHMVQVHQSENGNA